MNTIQRLWRQRRGGNAIEFAMTCPLFFAILLGVMDYGWLFANQAGINNAAAMSCREGAMVDAAFGSPTGTASAELSARSSMWCGGSCGLGVTLLNAGIYAIPNTTLQCSVTMNYTPLIGFVPSPATITSTAFYRLEWQR